MVKGLGGYGLGFRLEGLRLWVAGSGFRCTRFGVRESRFGVRGSRFGVRISWCGVLGYEVRVSRFDVRGL